MSKERRFALTKWRLGKLLVDYVSHKKDKREQYGSAYEDAMLHTEYKHRSKKKYPCKKLKGEHDFVVVESATYFKDIFITYRCFACNKKKLEFIKKDDDGLSAL